MVTERFQHWSHFPVTVACKSIKSHLPDYLLTLSVPSHSVVTYDAFTGHLIKQLELEINAGIKTQKSSFKSSLLKANPFFSNEDIPAYGSDECGTVKRHKNAFDCKYVLKSPSTQ